MHREDEELNINISFEIKKGKITWKGLPWYWERNMNYECDEFFQQLYPEMSLRTLLPNFKAYGPWKITEFM